MLQSVLKIGNSVGVIIPKALREKLGIKPGNKIIIEEGPSKSTLTIRTKNAKTGFSSITPEFVEIVERINKRYGPAFKELAGK